VQVFDENGEEYNKLYEGIFNEEKSYETWTVIEAIGIQLPFMNKINSLKEKKKNYKMEAHWAGIGWGFANISDKNYNLNNINGVDLKSESSNEFYWNVIEKILPIIRNNIGLTTGLGMSWRNYFLDTNEHFEEINKVTVLSPVPVGVIYEKSRLRTFQLTVPLMLEFQPYFGNNHKFFMTAGVIGGITTFASHKTEYATENTKKRKGLNIAPLNLDYMAQIGYGNLSIYAKYSPFSIFQSQKGPNLRAVSVGGCLHF
jgi:hypothetical protein